MNMQVKNIRPTIASYEGVAEEIAKINTILFPYDLKVDDIVQSAQIIRYKINLPMDVKAQGKIRRAMKDIERTISTILQTSEFTFDNADGYLYIERQATFNPISFGYMVDNKDFMTQKGLKLTLGVDMDGNRLYTDLSKAPHILIGGTTGSGKSELLHAFLASLIWRYNSFPCYITVIDPKRSEFSMYRGCNCINLVSEVNEATNVLMNACMEMDRRYALIESHRCKDIYTAPELGLRPYVIIIDELADLMMQNPEVEMYIARIAQKARACGIHLIIGTQTPRADVITGLIKSNMPTRIALRTTSSLESRIILDRNGAEKLYGKGDMLYLGNGAFNPIRIQSPYVCEEDKQSIANCLIQARMNQYGTKN